MTRTQLLEIIATLEQIEAIAADAQADLLDLGHGKAMQHTHDKINACAIVASMQIHVASDKLRALTDGGDNNSSAKRAPSPECPGDPPRPGE